METFETQFIKYNDKKTHRETVLNNTEAMQKRVNNIMETADIFGLNKEKKEKLANYVRHETKEQINQLSDNNEINKDEAQLAKMFWKYEELMNINEKQVKEPLSLVSVMQAYDKYELSAA